LCGTGELRSVAARRKTATSGGGTQGGRTVHAELSASGGESQFVAASCNQLRVLRERRLEDLNLVVPMIDGIHFGGQVLVALGIAESGEKHVLGVWQRATEGEHHGGQRRSEQ